MTIIIQAKEGAMGHAERSGLQRRIERRYGPWAVVTGASDGIGRAMAVQIARCGLGVVLVARRGDVLERLADELRRERTERVRVVAADLAHEEGVRAVLRATEGLDVGLLIASAGFGTAGDFVALPISEELQMIDVNIRSVAALAHEFARRFVARGRGGLVLMSSLVAFQGVPRAANYAATKAYVQSLAEGLRHELAPHGVDVLATAPGPVHSGFAARASMKMGLAQSPEEVASSTLRALGRQGTVRPGTLAKLLEYSLRLLPRWGRVLVMQRVMRSMTREAPRLSSVA